MFQECIGRLDRREKGEVQKIFQCQRRWGSSLYPPLGPRPSLNVPTTSCYCSIGTYQSIGRASDSKQPHDSKRRKQLPYEKNNTKRYKCIIFSCMLDMIFLSNFTLKINHDIKVTSGKRTTSRWGLSGFAEQRKWEKNLSRNTEFW